MIRLIALGVLLLTTGSCWAGQAEVVVTAKRAGAHGDGVRDDTAALRRLFTRLPKRPVVTIDLGSGTYLVSGFQTSASCGRYVLGLGVTTGLPATLRLVGKGARIVTNQKTDAQLLAIVAKFSSLSVEGVTFERKEIATASDVNFTGGPGVFVTDSKAKQVVNSVSFTNCSFINCHRGITADSRFNDLTNDLQNPFFVTAGLLKKLEVNRCAFLYPYASNSTDSRGGSQAFFSGRWVEKMVLKNCRFDGAENGTVAQTPNHRPKDGFFIGAPLNLVAEGNHLANFGVEGIYACVQGAVAYVIKPFAMPPARTGKKSHATTIYTNGSCNLLKPGMRIWYMGGGYLTVHKIRSATEMDVYSTGASGNAPAGTVLPAGMFLAVPYDFSNSFAQIDNNVIVGGILKGSPALMCGRPGIRVDNLRALIRGNQITAQYGIMLVGLGKISPLLGRQYGSIVSGNTIDLIDTAALYRGAPISAASGLDDFSYEGVTIQNNTIVMATNKNATGVSVNASNVRVLNNQISAKTAVAGSTPSRGVLIGNLPKMSAETMPEVAGNTFSLLDVGIGGLSPFKSVQIGPGNVYHEVGRDLNLP